MEDFSLDWAIVGALIIMFTLMFIGLHRLHKVEHTTAAMQQRFMEAGIDFADRRLATEVRTPEQWVETDGMSEEEFEMVPHSTGVIRSRNQEWVEP